MFCLLFLRPFITAKWGMRSYLFIFILKLKTLSISIFLNTIYRRLADDHLYECFTSIDRELILYFTLTSGHIFDYLFILKPLVLYTLVEWVLVFEFQTSTQKRGLCVFFFTQKKKKIVFVSAIKRNIARCVTHCNNPNHIVLHQDVLVDKITELHLQAWDVGSQKINRENAYKIIKLIFFLKCSKHVLLLEQK